jgi:beta-mannosidase
LLVWQDFMFACTAYPLEDTAFLDDVYEEIRYQIRRLRNETAIALWCGNNELQSFGTGDAPDRMSWEDYEKFFHHDVAAIVAEEDPSRAYWPCSPHSPGFELKDDNNPASGDAHLWAVWHGLEPFEWYRTAFHRFCSEFGFQSYPEPKTIAAITTPADHNITHPVMEHHQRSSAGNAKILHYMLSWFRMPAGFEQTLWLSQLQQGLAIQYAVHHWRRNWPRCAGALYWQLNDTWPAATWSSIDYFGRWKALHYFAKRFFAPIVISGVEAGSSVHLHVSCDHIEPRDAVLDWLVTDLNGATHSEGTLPVRLQPHASQHVQSLDLSDAVMALGERNLLLWLTLSDANAILAEEMLSLVRPKALALQPPELDWHLQQHDGRARLAVTTKRPALWMWITCADADPIWSDNFVCLRPGRSYFFDCMPDATNPTAPNPHSIQLRSLIDLSEPKPNLPKQC